MKLNTVWSKLVLAVVIAAPLGVNAADDEKKTDAKTATVTIEARANDAAGDDQKQEKRLEVRVQRVDGTEGEKPQIRLYRSEQGGKPIELKVLGLDGLHGGAALKVLVDGQVVADKAAEKQPYLGVAVDSVPPALVAHLPGLVSNELGLLVTNVNADSPAAKAGLKQHDIMVTYDDQKLVSFDQLTKLVRGDKPGRDVSLGVVRGGKLEKMKATLAEREVTRSTHVLALPGAGHEQVIELKNRLEGLPNKGLFRGEILKKLEEKAAADKPITKIHSNFSSMSLKSLDGDRFKAEIEFKNDKGETRKRSFEGTRDEIKKEIEADREMPEAIRDQLLRSLEFGGATRGKRAFQFPLPHDGAFVLGDFDADGHDEFFFKSFKWPVIENLDQLVDQISGDVDPQVREQLRKALRSIEHPKTKPAPAGQPL